MPVVSFTVFLLLALATARLTSLITVDAITARMRNALIYRQGNVRKPRPFLHGLLSCQWCTSIWVAAAVVAAVTLWHDHEWLWWVAFGLAFSQVAGMVSKLGRD